jgi:phosphatidate cytidylyltransferase
MGWGRIVPAALLGPLVFWIATREAVPAYLIGVPTFAAIGAGELYRLLWQHGHRPLWPLGGLLAVAIGADAVLTEWRLFPHLVVGATFAALLWYTFRLDQRGTLLDWTLTLAPPLYTGGLLGYYGLLRRQPDGALWVPMVLLCIWAADSAAYAIGRRWGRHKLAPRLSPGKSVEGGIAGVVGAAGCGAVVAAVTGRPLVLLVGLGLVVGVAGLAGDLAESWIKRQLGAKDSSRLLAEHGGMLDRLDSLLGAGMVAYYYLIAFGG